MRGRGSYEKTPPGWREEATSRRALLEIEQLHVSFTGLEKPVRAVRGVSLSVYPREIHALVGESGSGKSVTVRTILGLLPKPPARSPARVDHGSIWFKNHTLSGLDEASFRRLRGGEIGMIFQEAGKYLNPSMTIRAQIDEMLKTHLALDAAECRLHARELAEMVELPLRTLESYPHELSGGMKQRALIAMAISCKPSLLIADEPTTALDASVQGQILELILKLRNELDMAVLFVSHDLAVVQQIADTISVMYAGTVVEQAGAAELFRRPLHPYSDLLIQAVPDPQKRGMRLRAISGRVPDAEHIPDGCPFHPRCPIARDRCRTEVPPLHAQEQSHPAACHYAGELLASEVSAREQ